MPGHSQVLIRTLPLLLALGVVAVCCRTVQADTRSEARIQVTLKIPPWVRLRPAQPATRSANTDSYCFYRAPGSPYSLSMSDSEGSPVEAVNVNGDNALCDSPQAQALSVDKARDVGQDAQRLTLMVQSE